MKVWGVFIDTSYMTNAEKEKIKDLADVGKHNLLFDFQDLRDAVEVCDQLIESRKREIMQKLVSQCGYSVERALECIKTIKPRYFVAEFIE